MPLLRRTTKTSRGKHTMYYLLQFTLLGSHLQLCCSVIALDARLEWRQISFWVVRFARVLVVQNRKHDLLNK